MPILPGKNKGTSVPISEEQLQGILKRYDTNGDGKISKKELKVAFKDLGMHFCGFKAGRAIRHADANGDGVISPEELAELATYASKRWGFTIN